MSQFIVDKRVKQLALSEQEKRYHNFTRVSQSFLDEVDSRVRLIVQRMVKEHPSKGKTLMA